MDRPDEGPPAKAPRLSDSESPPSDPQPPPPPPPPPLLRLPLPPPQQRQRPLEETEAAQVLADMRGVGMGLGPALPPPPPYVILEEGGIRAYFTLGAEGSDWEPGFESGFGDPSPPPGSLEALTAEDASGGSVEIDFQVVEPSGFSDEKVLETCSAGGWEPQMLASSQGGEEAVILVEDDDEDEKESVKKKRRRRRRRRRQRKVKREIDPADAEKIECILQALENIQLDLEAVNIKAGKAFLRLKRKFIQLRRPYLEQRDLIIQHIPGFWIKAFLNHPRISMLINQRDEDIFRYLTNLQVQDLRHISMGYKMKLYFQTNPYFTNTVIVKEFQRNCSGRLVSHSTPIRWHRGQEPQDQEPQNHRMKKHKVKQSFFDWFSNHSLPDADIIAEIIKNDLWVNPVRYYMMGEEGYMANKKKQEKRKRKNRNGYEVVILEDYDDYHIMKDIIDTSDSDISDFETIHDIKISDFMETTDCFDTTDNEVTDNENLCSHNKKNDIKTTNDDENPDDNESFDDETTDDEGPGNKDSSDGDNNPVGCKKPKWGNLNISGINQDSSDIESEISDDNYSNEGSDDDGNEGDDEGSGDDDGDDDRDFEDFYNASENSAKNQVNRNNLIADEYKVENFSESSVEEEEPDSEEGSNEEVFEEMDDNEDAEMQEVLLVQNAWMNLGKKGGRTG